MHGATIKIGSSFYFQVYTSQAKQLSTMKTVREKASISCQDCVMNGRMLRSCQQT